MVNNFFSACLLMCSVALFGQEGYEIDFFAGPNITNVVIRNNSQPVLVGITDRRPYNSINFLLGIKLKKSVNRFDFSALILFEKIRNSSNGFNSIYKPVSNYNINYLGTTIEVLRAPLLNSNVKFGIGGSFYYALNKKIGRRDLFVLKRAAWGPVTSLQIPISKKISFTTRFFFGLNNLRNELDSIDLVLRTEKPFSFQFVFDYTLFNVVK